MAANDSDFPKQVVSWIRLSRKYTFALIGIVSSIIALVIVQKIGFPESVMKYAIMAPQAVILVITITYLTGQAKIDFQAVYGGKTAPFNLPNNPFQGREIKPAPNPTPEGVPHGQR